MVQSQADNRAESIAKATQHREEKKLSKSSVAGDEVEELDTDLVNETRDLVVQEYETSLARGEQIYSRRHYQEIVGSDAACWRYLVQRDRRPKDAFELIKGALAWRKREKVDELDAKMLAKEFWLKAPIGFVGKTRDGDDLMYVIGKNYRKPSSADVKQIVKNVAAYALAEWDRRHMDSLEKFAVVFDVYDTTFSNVDLEFNSWLISIIEYFPARFASIHVIGVPFILRPVIRLVISWLPERFRRICYCGTREQLLADLVDEDNLPDEVGGSAPNTWRLAPIEAPWAEHNELYSEKVLRSLDSSICHNTAEERIEEFKTMQRNHEALEALKHKNDIEANGN